MPTEVRAPDRTEAWHAQPAPAVLEALESSDHGLSEAEARRRLEQHGPNALELAAPRSAWAILWDQLRSVVVALLAVAALISWMLGDLPDAIAIAVVLLINITIGFVTEWRARRAMEALKTLEVRHATVVREGRRTAIDAAGLVPGDVIELEAGQAVPADARLLRATGLRVNEAPLTGESLPVDKDPGAAVEAAAGVADRLTMVHQATSVLAGTARAMVVATGRHTQVGRIGTLTSAVVDERTPLEDRLDRLGRRLVVATLGVAAIVGLLGWLRGEEPGFVLQTAIALAIAAVPEGLPAVATITLALGVWRMARRQALVRRLPAVETLGSATVVCTDKTGTLTAGEMTVVELALAEGLVTATGTGYGGEGTLESADVSVADHPALREALRIAVLVNRAELDAGPEGTGIAGDPTEAALLVVAAKGGVDRDAERDAHPEEREIPFSSERKWMALVHSSGGGAVAYLKGAPDRLLEHATHEATGAAPRALDDAARARWEDRNADMASRGLRVIALARAEPHAITEEALGDLTIVALAGLADPAAEGVVETIARFQASGIRTVMITGDQRLTAAAVARALGLPAGSDDVLDGRDLAVLDDQALAGRVDRIAVYDRVSPADKLRIVEALRERGEIVAMLGDGVNDAAALRKADIGVAMGVRGTDIAKEASDVVLADDRFATIGVAVEQGRVIFDNIRKFIFYLFSCNVAEVMVLFTAALIGLPQPLLPLQILWLNLVTDTFPALALAVEPAESDVMRRPPHDPDEAILSRRFLAGIATYGALMTMGVLIAYLIALRSGSPERARTVAFMVLALAQAVHLGNARSADLAFHVGQALTNRWALGALALVVALQLGAVYAPALAGVLDLVPLTAGDWMVVVPFALTPVAGGAALRLWRGSRARASAEP